MKVFSICTNGEYLDLTTYGNLMKKFNKASSIRVENAGRFAFKGKEDNWCGVESGFAGDVGSAG